MSYNQNMKSVLILFGGISPEHEVSVITGLQVLENIDKKLYKPSVIYVDKNGKFFLLKNIKTRSDFFSARRSLISFGKDAHGGFIKEESWGNKKTYPYVAFLAFHGGFGERGQVQGLLESVGVPFTSSGQESSVITMNKELTRRAAESVEIPVAHGMSIFASEIKKDIAGVAVTVIRELSLPVIIKPVHLGSSIGLNIAKTEVELQKFLLEGAFIDNEILIEQYLSLAAEYNCAVRMVDGTLEASEIERPVSKDEILSFADKYQRGAKKSGSGMASLSRELPAKIDEALKHEIQDLAKKIFVACSCKGVVRVDFMVTTNKKLYLTEVNPIPGSMAFYLWEASGISFRQQISDLIEQAVRDDAQTQSMDLDYKTDIVEKFIAQKEAESQ
jgi:D-alanine-D-alanine ligase